MAPSTAIINNTDILVGSFSNPLQQIGLDASTGTPQITVNGGTVFMNGSGVHDIHTGNVQFDNQVVCTINGIAVDCATS
jgi:hypothetical protein